MAPAIAAITKAMSGISGDKGELVVAELLPTVTYDSLTEGMLPEGYFTVSVTV